LVEGLQELTSGEDDTSYLSEEYKTLLAQAEHIKAQLKE